MLRRPVFQYSLPDDSFALRLSAFYVTTFLIVGCYMPYLPLWLDARGLSDGQISLIYAVPVLVRAVFIPGMTFLADKSGSPARLVGYLCWGAFLSILALPFASGFEAIFAIILLYTMFWMSVLPLTDTIALAGARLGRGDYGRMRLWGSLSFITMTSGGGAVIDLWGASSAIWLFVGAGLAVVLSAFWLPDDKARQGGPDLPKPQPRLSDMARLMRVPDLWLFLIAAGVIQSAHAVYYIFGTLHWTSAGIPSVIIGALWGIGVIAEIVLFAYGARVSRFCSPVQLIVLAGAASILRWTVTACDPPLAVLFVVQALHGVTFGAAHLGAMQFLSRAIPGELAASAQGLYASITASVAMGLVSLAAGPLYRTFDGGAYFAMAALGLVGLVLALLLLRRWLGGLIVASN